LTGCANVQAPLDLHPGFLGEVSMKKLVAMVFFAMFAGNVMAQAGGASSGAGAAGGAGGAAGATAGVVATAAAAVAGVAAASSNNSNSANH
jgi:hypothetical protein